MASVAQLEAALVKADAAGNADDARMLAAEIRRLRTVTTATPAAAMAEIPQRRGLAAIGDRSTGFRPAGQSPVMNMEQGLEGLKTAAAIGAGIVAGPALAAGSRALGVALPVLQRVTTPLATAFRTGGFQSGLPQTAPAAARLASRVVGAAVPGAIAGGIISPEEAATGAAVSTGIAMVAPPVAKIVAKGAGAVVDALAGRTADVRANQLIRLAANDEVNALRAAMRAQPDVPASRAAADLDMPVLQALLAEAEKKDPRGVVNAFRQREAQNTVNELTRIAGGPTAETARAARETAKESLGDLTGRIREEAIGKARQTNITVPKLDRIAVEAREASKEATDAVRRIGNAVNKSDDWARNWVEQRGIGEAGVRLPGRVEATATFPGQLAMSGRQTTIGGPFERQVIDEGGAIAGRMSRAAEESVKQGARARAAEATLRMKTQRGEVPITVGKLTSAVTAVLNKPDIAANAQASAALNRINQMLEARAVETGIIDPADVYAIRKWGVTSVIDELNPTADATARKRLTAKVLSEIKPYFDGAIENAGGKEFGNYLRSFERGMSDITGMKLADQIRRMYQQGQKQQIVDLIAGESPDVVEDLFGSGRYQISKEMAKDMPLLQRIADTAGTDLKTVEQAAAGRAALTEAQRKTSARIRFPFFTRASTAVNEVVAGLEQKMKAETMNTMIRAAQSGREFNRVLDSLPTKERNVFLAQFKNAQSWNKFTTEIGRASQAYAASKSAEE